MLPKDIEMMTGIKVSGSSQHRLVQRYKFAPVEVKGAVTALSIDGGKVRLRTPKGLASEWKDYKAVSLHGTVCAAFFQENQPLIDWVNAQPLAPIVTSLGDGHDGVWNLMAQIGESHQRREVLDWFHLNENWLFGLCYAMNGGYKGWNPYIEKHLAIFVNYFRSRTN